MDASKSDNPVALFTLICQKEETKTSASENGATAKLYSRQAEINLLLRSAPRAQGSQVEKECRQAMRHRPYRDHTCVEYDHVRAQCHRQRQLSLREHIHRMSTPSLHDTKWSHIHERRVIERGYFRARDRDAFPNQSHMQTEIPRALLLC